VSALAGFDDKEEEDFVMERSRAAEFLIGLTVGALISLLFAPRSGKKTRTWITQTTTDGAAYVKDCGGTVLGVLEQGKETIIRHKHGVAEAVKLGTREYKRAVG
jgi:gas vesicle protein